MLSENTYTATIGANGRIVIPAAIRKANGWKEGDDVLLFYDKTGKVEIADPLQSLEEARAFFQAHQSDDKETDAVAEFLKERRKEWGEE